jgi:hypothetical protein
VIYTFSNQKFVSDSLDPVKREAIGNWLASEALEPFQWWEVWAGPSNIGAVVFAKTMTEVRCFRAVGEFSMELQYTCLESLLREGDIVRLA